MKIVRIPLRDGQQAIIDEADAPTVKRLNWYLEIKSNTCYACTPVGGGRNVTMHRFLMNPPTGKVVDHVNANGLDNRRCNLRIVTQSQNHMNRRKSPGTTSRFKGVYYQPGRGRYMARIKVDGQTIYLGRFADEESAALAYNEAARIHFGDNARLNPVDDEDANFVASSPPVKQRPPKPLPTPEPHPEISGAVLIGLGRGFETIIDATDSASVAAYRWYANIKKDGMVYAVGCFNGRLQRGLHVFLMEPADGMIVDHINGNKLDNRRCNLRVVTAEQNRWNNQGRKHRKSHYKGIHWDAGRRLWQARITINKKTCHLGRYPTAEDAARAYNARAAEAFGEFARLNRIR